MRTQETKKLGRQAGVTLMELIAALAIMAVIIVGALSLYNSASTSQISTQMVQDVSALRAAIKSMYLGQGSFASLDNSVLIGSKRVPTTIKNTTGSTLKHQLNGDVTIAPADSNAAYTITFGSIPQDVCVALLTSAQQWISVTGIASGAAAQTTLPVPPDTANTQCTNTGTGNVVFKGN